MRVLGKGAPFKLLGFRAGLSFPSDFLWPTKKVRQNIKKKEREKKHFQQKARKDTFSQKQGKASYKERDKTLSTKTKQEKASIKRKQEKASNKRKQEKTDHLEQKTFGIRPSF